MNTKTQQLNNIDPDQLERDVYAEYQRDGLIEIVLGMLLFVTAAMFEGSFVIGLYIVFALVIFPRALKELREKYTYPRLGYVKFREETDATAIGFFIFFIIVIFATGLALMLMTNDITILNIYKMTPLFFGLVMIGPMSFLYKKSGLKRYWIYVAGTVITGLIISFITLDNPNTEQFDGLKIQLVGWGFLFILIGTITFLRFLKLPIQEEIESE